MSRFTWVPFYKELATKLIDYRDRQGELLGLLKEIEERGIPVTSLDDKKVDGMPVPLDMIDPFTFFASFNRGTTVKNRQSILEAIKTRLQLAADVPTDFDGIPVVYAARSRFFAWQFERKDDDVPALWSFAEAIVRESPDQIDPSLFNRCLNVNCVSVNNLSMGMFWMRPDTYLALDKLSRGLLENRGVSRVVDDWASYLRFLKEARSHIAESPYEFSYAAYENSVSDVQKAGDDVVSKAKRGGGGMQCWKVSHGRDSFSNEQRQASLQDHTLHIHGSTRKGQGDDFAETMKVGDYFYLCHGNDDGIRVFGRITGAAVPSPHSDGWLQRSYEPLFNGIKPDTKYVGPQKGWTPNHNSTCVPVPSEELGLFETEILEPFFGKRLSDVRGLAAERSVPAERSVRMHAALPSRNIILYGPPGTGKTYALRNQYMAHFTEQKAPLSREGLAAEIVADLAWWQVITMVLLDLRRSNVAGILAHPLMAARIRRANNQTPRAAIWAHLQMHTKMDCEEVKYTKRYEPLLFSKDSHSIWSIDETLAAEEVPDLVEALNRYRGYTPGQGAEIKRYEFTTFHQSCSYEDFVEGIKPVMSEEEAGSVAYEIKPGIFKTMVARAIADPGHDYALIIDEISRGNVANIFGELIALIEDDKRAGAPNELHARLTYSREDFVVPKNLYIIGAMNTADRSVEALDTALRRRFTFIATPPRPDLIPQPVGFKVDLKRLLASMNARIEKLVDKDHCIGHSYFMGIAGKANALDELRSVFATKILPLMEEYFYGDFAKIGMVLGERFVKRKDAAVEWADGEWGIDDFEERRVYELSDSTSLDADAFCSVYE